ncbi:uncharacterized protein EI90DRAFT_3146978 [Cantharellus anzutake]|uniref:uncharacterized protein n=1 Tax=Cantharellus anzutake TaxID=1750568 RepID=UPI00190712F0|nr:uncharacterized protein EI90DRAFT_3146978 [Cantharellus anzutake]KAF8323532.1 hypothetical protein EI90DRAFT_3146978 [Cantharellus anzutake]
MSGLDEAPLKIQEQEVNEITNDTTHDGNNRDAMANDVSSSKFPNRSQHVMDLCDNEEEIEDPDAVNFINSNAAFRGPMDHPSSRGWSESSSSKAPRRRRSSWLGSVDVEGFFRRWVEEPLGLSSAAEEPLPDTQIPGASESHRKPGSTLTNPKGSSSHSEAPGSSKLPSRSVTWEFATRRLRPRKDGSGSPLPGTISNGAITSDASGDKDGTTAADGSPRLGENTGTPPRSTTARLASRRWALIKNRFIPGQSNAASSINISDELLAGGLATLILRMHFERDEHDHRRIPVLLHHLKIRVSDSVHPISGTHTVFRIECQYANGAARWVIYRGLRDFVTLHTHYRVAKVYGRAGVGLPEFPLTSLPYFKFLKSQNPNASHAERRASFARLQRMHLENYLLALIKAVMFRPEANRLARFFEISALNIALANSGGVQGKAGLLRVTSGETSRRSANRRFSWIGSGEAAKPRWWNVRESYLVVVEDPGETTIWDVFFLDSQFSIERPKRYYRVFDPRTHDEDDYVSHSSSEDEEMAAHAREQLPDPNSMAISPSSSGVTFKRISKFLRISKEDKGKSSSEWRIAKKRTPQASEVPPNGAAEQPMRLRQKGHKSQAEDASPAMADLHRSASHVFVYTRYMLSRQLHQWITSLERMAEKTHWTKTNRFDSFAPIRLNVAAQWLVDGRDYFWNVSRAINLAKEKIYIHDWWLSPELQLRRPNKHHYRIDRLLKRKAEQGVKIFVIIYKEFSSRTTPTDSNYTKQRLQSLHPNIMVQRSPSHFATGTFYWAHHEKLCIIDEAIAFTGGLDMCFGRWDTPQHALVDDPQDMSQRIWPGMFFEFRKKEKSVTPWAGKDYANERVVEFHTLTKPYDDMFDRSKVPRMPWHDVGVQILGPPARDLCRHFVQRWNHLLRIKAHTRLMPFLLPPAEFRPQALDDLGLTGTCEVQICRSAGNWSMGFQHHVEHSIQNAYLKAIQMSEHFVYIENQFFITSTVVNDVKVENQIGDALVSRIIKAHQERTPWRACILIPLLPGFAFPIDHSDASAVRLILECQNRTISRGPDSIFARLRKEGIDPNDYITFFSLRTWGKLRGEILTTEQMMIVDDRLAIIGSANINERSQRGDRDSELVAVIRDTDMIDSMMGGRPFTVGRFAHTLRIRLMREHVGVDVDALYGEDPMANSPSHPPEEVPGARQNRLGVRSKEDLLREGESPGSKVENHHSTHRNGRNDENFPDSGSLPTEEQVVTENRLLADESQQAARQEVGDSPEDVMENGQVEIEQVRAQANGIPAEAETLDTDQPPRAHDIHADSDPHQGETISVRKPPTIRVGRSPWTLPNSKPKIDPHGFKDPLIDSFYKDVWIATAAHNTEIFRKVFHCTPDDSVTTWKQYKDFHQHHDRITKPVMKDSASIPARSEAPSRPEDEKHKHLEAPSAERPISPLAMDSDAKEDPSQLAQSRPIRPSLSSRSATPADDDPHTPSSESRGRKGRDRAISSNSGPPDGSVKPRRPTHLGEPLEAWERDEMEALLKETRGHLVIYPTRFLEGEDVSDNFLFNADRLLPLPIYN